MSNNQDDDGDIMDGEEYDKSLRPVYPTAGQQRCLRFTQCGCAILLLLTGIVLFILALATNQTGLIVQTVTTFRTGANSANPAIDALPAAAIVSLGTVDVSVFYAFVAIFGAIGFALVWFMGTNEVREIAGGSDGYMWASFMLSHILLWEAIILTLGINALGELIFFGLLVFAWLSILWVGGQLNQIFYRETLRLRTQKDGGSGSTWSWAFYVFTLIIFIPAIIYAYVAAYYTYGSTHAGLASTAPTLNLIAPIVGTVLYFLLFIVLALHYADVAFIKMTATYVTAMYVINGILLFFVPVLAVVLFLFDSVTIPE